MTEQAPPRGCYDRRSSADERANLQRRRLIRAAAGAFRTMGASANVSHAVAKARVGRNTFYAHFRDFDSVLDVAEQQALNVVTAFVAGLPASDALNAQVRALACGWLAALDTESDLMSVALRRQTMLTEAPLSRAGVLLLEALTPVLAALRECRRTSMAPDPVRVIGVVAAMEGIGRWYIQQAEPRPDVSQTIIDLIERVFR